MKYNAESGQKLNAHRGRDYPSKIVLDQGFDAMDFIQELSWRGLLSDASDRDAIQKLAPGTAFFIGFDPTAPSLQVGNLLPILVTITLARAGLSPIILFGGATGSIGDPSGKSVERPLLAREIISSNVEVQKEQIRQILGRVNCQATFVDNFDWTKDVSVLDFLRDVGKHFTVNYMIAKDVVKNRLGGEGISYTEFSYMLLQAFDFNHLYQKFNCKLQIGGSDQWGNITAGLELIRRKSQGEAYALSWPLLLNAQGKKFGKSESGALWLSPQLTSPFKFHQFWLNVEDADAVRFLKIFTFLSEAEIQSIAAAQATSPEKRIAQRTLADAVCTLVHGAAATKAAEQSAHVLFGGSLEGISDSALLEIFSDIPSKELSKERLRSAAPADIFVESGALKSKSEVRRLISNGGAYWNNERVSDDASKLPETFLEREVLLLRTGKKTYLLVKITA